MTGPVANVQVYFVCAVMDVVRVNLPISLTCLCDSAFEQERDKVNVTERENKEKLGAGS